MLGDQSLHGIIPRCIPGVPMGTTLEGVWVGVARARTMLVWTSGLYIPAP